MKRVKKAPPPAVASLATLALVLSFGALVPITAQAAVVSLPGWSVTRIAIPKGGEIREASVEFETASHEKLSLTPGIRSHGGFMLDQVEWFGEPRRARVSLRKGDDRAELLAEAAAVVTVDRPSSARRQIEIETRLVEVTADAAKSLPLLGGADGPVSAGPQSLPEGLIAVISEEEFHAQLESLTQRRGADVLTTPRVTTKSGQNAEVEVFHEFRYPTGWEPAAAPKKGWVPKTFETKNLGTTTKIEAVQREDGAIDLKLEPRLVELLGFVDFVTKKPLTKLNRERLFERALDSGTEAPRVRAEPVFSTRQATLDCTVKSGQTAIFVLPPIDPPPGFASPSNGRVLLGLVSARWVTPEQEPPAPAAVNLPPPAAAPPADALPVPDAKPVVGKPGFVTSPHAPNAGFIDVRGFPAGTEVKDPYSGKLFRVPSPRQNPGQEK